MKNKRTVLVAGMVLGLLLCCAPLLGAIGAALGVARAHATLGSSGISDPKALSENIEMTLFSTAAGVVLLPVGVVLLVVCFVLYLQLRESYPPPLPPRQE